MTRLPAKWAGRSALIASGNFNEGAASWFCWRDNMDPALKIVSAYAAMRCCLIFGDIVSIMDIPASSQLKVLVVDDDELNQRMMNLILTREGHQVHIAVNGLDATRAVESHDFDIILMDLQMPMMDGVEASRRIREVGEGGKNAYIVALTASYLPERGQELFDAGIDNYIAKPFNVEHLRQMLEYGLDHRRSRGAIEPPILNAITVPYETTDFDTRAGIVLVGGDEDTYRELLAEFVDKLPEKNEMLDKYFAEKDIKNLARIAHNIKGVSSNLGALQLFEYADKLEKTANDGYTITALEKALREVKEVSRKFIMDASNFLTSIKNDLSIL